VQILLIYGVSHYPEVWSKDRFYIDIELMKKAKVKVVRLGEFAWSLMEPREGVYDFSWLRELVEDLGRNSIYVILGTPTAAPPPWLIKKYPEIMPVDYHGHSSGYGIRREYCPNNPVYREFAKKITGKLAEEFKDSEYVIGFQIDNEVALPFKFCYCRYCIEKFRRYLEEKYGDIENLNKVMGALIWSHKYNDFSEIYPPGSPFDFYNRSLTMEWLRFRSRSMVEFVRTQYEIIKSIAPNKFVTTNLIGLGIDIDYYDLCNFLDISSVDVYPKMRSDEYNPPDIAFVYDAIRGMSRNKSFIVMELQAGPTDGYNVGSISRMLGVTPEPGELRKWAYQAIAHGAEGVLFWNWRTLPVGKEQFWYGLLDHDGVPRRRYYEASKLFEELNNISSYIDGTFVDTKIAVTLSYESIWAADIIEKGYYPYKVIDETVKTYRALWINRVAIDLVQPKANLGKYRLVFAPSLYLVDDEVLNNLIEFVRNGGVLIVTPRSFVKDEFNRVRENKTNIIELLGVEVEEFSRLPPNDKVKVSFSSSSFLLPGETHHGSSWLEVYKPIDGEVLASASWRWINNKPVLVCKRHGSGMAISIGTILSQETLEKLAHSILRKMDVKPIVEELNSVRNIEFYARSNGNDEYIIFAINHGSESNKVSFRLTNGINEVVELISSKRLGSKDGVFELYLDPHDVAILYIKN